MRGPEPISSAPAGGPVHEVLVGREVSLGGSTVVRRLLPTLGRRLVGPWCFVDHYGPDDVANDAGMAVPPHPHIGLQTVSWLLAGDVRHRDSLGSDQLISPGQLGLMTAGQGIAHAEHSPSRHLPELHGVQLWVALPAAVRSTAAAWEHHPHLPTIDADGVVATVIMGELAGERSPGRTYSPIVGADLTVAPAARSVLPLEPGFEHAVLLMSGEAVVDGVELRPGGLLYLGSGRSELPVAGAGPARLLLLGGEPFGEQIVMWWNFVGGTGEEITAARERWMTGDGFGSVTGAGERTPAPGLPPGVLKPGGAVRPARVSRAR